METPKNNRQSKIEIFDGVLTTIVSNYEEIGMNPDKIKTFLLAKTGVLEM